jgi:hypothetical protein
LATPLNWLIAYKLKDLFGKWKNDEEKKSVKTYIKINLGYYQSKPTCSILWSKSFQIKLCKILYQVKLFVDKSMLTILIAQQFPSLKMWVTLMFIWERRFM